MERALDRIDRRIIRLLQKNARLSNKELASEVDLAESSCLERVRRLQAEGVLRGFHAAIDLGKVGAQLQAMVMIRLKKHSRDVVESFRDHMLSLPEVVDVYLLAGVHDFMIHVVAPDSAYLRKLELDRITTWEEVVHIETSLIFEHHRDHVFPTFPVDAEAEPGA